jgi:hypothetical protein
MRNGLRQIPQARLHKAGSAETLLGLEIEDRMRITIDQQDDLFAID